MSTNLFVYGTLKSDFDRRAARFLRSKAKFLGKGSVNGHLYDLGSYPALVLTSEGEDLVQGEVYQLTSVDEVLDVLDRYEGDEYARKEVEVSLQGNLILCWTYEYLGETRIFPVIKSGMYENSSKKLS